MVSQSGDIHCLSLRRVAVTKSWSQPEVKGTPPSCRHGHVMVALGTDIYVHGGMAGTSIYDDLYKFDTGISKFMIFMSVL